MPGIRLVTDSAADLDRDDMTARGVTIVNLDVRLGEIGPELTKDWTPEEFWFQCSKSDVLPETSAPSPGAFQTAFQAAKQSGADGVVCVTMSSKLSATYQAAVAGADAMSAEIPVVVVDSLSITMGEGMGVLAGQETAEGGGDLKAVEEATRAALSKSRVFGAFDTLDNLRKGGRIGGAQAFVGSLLSIKPIIEVREGLVELDPVPGRQGPRCGPTPATGCHARGRARRGHPGQPRCGKLRARQDPPHLHRSRNRYARRSRNSWRVFRARLMVATSARY